MSMWNFMSKAFFYLDLCRGALSDPLPVPGAWSDKNIPGQIGLNVSIGKVMKTQEMLKFVPDHLKTKKLCKHAVKKLPYLIRYVPDGYKTQQICDKAILENGGTLKSIPDRCKNQEMCNNEVDN